MSVKDTRHFVYPLLANEYDVIDGDTVKVVLDYGRDRWGATALRLFGLDTPEKRKTRQGGQLEKESGLIVGRVVRAWLAERHEVVQLYATSDCKPKYSGRTVGRLYAGWPTFLVGDDCLNDYLLEQELARPYQGGKKHPWPEEQLKAIIVRAQAILAA